MRIALALLLFVAISADGAASEFDVYNLYPTNARGSVESTGFGRGQTFQMGKAGSLDAIIVTISNYDFAQSPATLKLYDLNGSETNGSPLTSIASSTATLTLGSSAPTNYTFEFDNLAFPAGKKLAFGLYGTQIALGLLDSGPPNSAPIVISQETIGFSARHAGFATVITPVPEPSTLSLAAISAIALLRRRRA